MFTKFWPKANSRAVPSMAAHHRAHGPNAYEEIPEEGGYKNWQLPFLVYFSPFSSTFSSFFHL